MSAKMAWRHGTVPVDVVFRTFSERAIEVECRFEIEVVKLRRVACNAMHNKCTGAS